MTKKEKKVNFDQGKRGSGSSASQAMELPSRRNRINWKLRFVCQKGEKGQINQVKCNIRGAKQEIGHKKLSAVEAKGKIVTNRTTVKNFKRRKTGKIIQKKN